MVSKCIRHVYTAFRRKLRLPRGGGRLRSHRRAIVCYEPRWLVSRESMPKQFVPLVGARSAFQQVLGRIRDATMFDRPIIITHSDFRFIVAEQMRACAVEGDIVLERMRRDSAMAG